MTVSKNESITIPKWLVIFLAPMIVAIVTSYVTAQVTSAKYELKIVELEKITDKKINKAEADLQFQFIKQQLDVINKKLDRNEQTTIDNQ